MYSINILTIDGIPEVSAGTDLGRLIAQKLRIQQLSVESSDVIVVAQKVVSKAEGRFVELANVVVSERARELADLTGKDPRLVEVILTESLDVVRARRGLLIVRHRLGFVMAQAGVDRSNVPGKDRVLLLPRNPDASAAALMENFRIEFGLDHGPGIIISDSFGRPWRQGTTNIALGVAGVPALWDRRGEKDRDGRTMESSQVAWADAIAAAAGMVMGECAEGIPVVLIRGLPRPPGDGSGATLIRPIEDDVFR